MNKKRSWWQSIVAAQYNALHLVAVSGFAGIACFLIARST